MDKIVYLRKYCSDSLTGRQYALMSNDETQV